jgi:hypothetical protein
MAPPIHGGPIPTYRYQAFDDLVDLLADMLIPRDRLQIGRRNGGGYWVAVRLFSDYRAEHFGPSVIDACRAWLNAESEMLERNAITWQLMDWDKAEDTA